MSRLVDGHPLDDRLWIEQMGVARAKDHGDVAEIALSVLFRPQNDSASGLPANIAGRLLATVRWQRPTATTPFRRDDVHALTENMNVVVDAKDRRRTAGSYVDTLTAVELIHRLWAGRW
ncbi:MAG: hypothetical protein DYG89_47965 [Caldilinea sp. CFX5]|nr:hypothetical protein [Caldilinea sp. CFX5]